MKVYVVGFAPADGDAATGGFDWFLTPDPAVSRARKDVREVGGLGKHSVTFVPLEVPDGVAYPTGGTTIDRDSITNWIDSNLHLVEVGLRDEDDDGVSDGPDRGQTAPGPSDAPITDAARQAVERLLDVPQTRPSAILRRPDPESAISEATTAELLYEALERAKAMRTQEYELARMARDSEGVGRELSICVTLLEDAITRHNKAVYMRRGVFAITDAERAPTDDAERVEPEVEPVVVREDRRARLLKGRKPVAVVARDLTHAMAEIQASAEAQASGWIVILEANHARGAQFSSAIFAQGWDSALTSGEADKLREIVLAGIR